MTDNIELQIKNKPGKGNAFKIPGLKEYFKKAVPRRLDKYHKFIFLDNGKNFYPMY